MQIDPRIRSELIRLADARPEINRLILFGSRARGDANERSDIDIAVEAHGISPENWLTWLDQLDNLNTLLPIDVIRYEEADSILRGNIDQEGKVLYERSENRAEFGKSGESVGSVTGSG